MTSRNTQQYGYDYNNGSWYEQFIAWRKAANEAMKFIKENVAIVGFDEIEAFKAVKQLVENAEKMDGLKRNSLHKPHTYHQQWAD